MENKRVLVLLSSYNGEQYIEQQIKSILTQRELHEVHIRIRDDGSTDGTHAIIERLMDENPGRIELLKGQNIGLNASFFELLKSADGYDYYAISDQDDVWLPEKLSTAVCSLETAGFEKDMPLLFASTSYLVDDDLKPFGQTRRQVRPFTIYNTIIQNICPGHTQVMNQALLKLIQKNWDTEKIYVYDSWIMNMAQLYGKIVFSNTSFTLYRQHKGNQLGSGSGVLGQLLSSGKRVSTNKGPLYRKQIAYFLEENREKLDECGYQQELEDFLNARTVKDRIRYCLRSKLYRQKKIETIAFYAAVIAGKF